MCPLGKSSLPSATPAQSQPDTEGCSLPIHHAQEALTLAHFSFESYLKTCKCEALQAVYLAT